MPFSWSVPVILWKIEAIAQYFCADVLMDCQGWRYYSSAGASFVLSGAGFWVRSVSSQKEKTPVTRDLCWRRRHEGSDRWP